MRPTRRCRTSWPRRPTPAILDVIQQANKNVNDISAKWSKSPAAISIQMDADALRPSMQHIGTVKQVDLMGKEFKVNINQQGERLAGEYLPLETAALPLLPSMLPSMVG